MFVETVHERGRVRKIAESPAEAERLAAEARVLAVAARPGVVRILEVVGGDPPSELVLENVDGVSLAGLCRPLTWPEVAGLGAALATTLGDLHDIGVVHRSVAEDQVILDGEGRPVLCGFGKAAVHPERRAARLESAEDLTALASLLLRLGAGTPPRPLARVLRTRKRTRLVPLDARQLARGLITSCPDARLPDRTCTSMPDDVVCPDTEGAARSKRRRLAAAILLVTACTLSCLRFDASFSTSTTTNRTAGCAARRAGCASLTVRPGSVISGPSGDFRLVGATGVLVMEGCLTRDS